MSESPKITAIFVAGQPDKGHLHGMRVAAKLFSKSAFVTTITTKTFPGITGVAPISKTLFVKTASRLIRDHGKGGFLHFAQFGHGGSEPSILLGHQFEFFTALELQRLFARNLNKSKQPYVAIILGGCYSGGFGKYFLGKKSLFSPDFFYAYSPPYTVSFGVQEDFYLSNCSKADYNRDGVVTLRERAICTMARANPFGVMFTLRGKPDVDLRGQKAKKPHFSKSVKKIQTHGKLMSEIRSSLRFGEQAVVMVEGADDAENEKMRKWFAKEANQGDGFYKFLMVKHSAKSQKFFATGGKPSIFAMGPNLRFRGVKLNTSSPIGDQLPRVLVYENPKRVIEDWASQFLSINSHSHYIISGYLKFLKENPSFRSELLKRKIISILKSSHENEIIKAFLLIKKLRSLTWLMEEIEDHLRRSVDDIVLGKRMISAKGLSIIISNLAHAYKLHTKKYFEALIPFALKRHGLKFVNLLIKEMDLFVAQVKILPLLLSYAKEVLNGRTNISMKDLVLFIKILKHINPYRSKTEVEKLLMFGLLRYGVKLLREFDANKMQIQIPHDKLFNLFKTASDKEKGILIELAIYLKRELGDDQIQTFIEDLCQTRNARFRKAICLYIIKFPKSFYLKDEELHKIINIFKKETDVDMISNFAAILSDKSAREDVMSLHLFLVSMINSSNYNSYPYHAKTTISTLLKNIENEIRLKQEREDKMKREVIKNVLSFRLGGGFSIQGVAMGDLEKGINSGGVLVNLSLILTKPLGMSKGFVIPYLSLLPEVSFIAINSTTSASMLTGLSLRLGVEKASFQIGRKKITRKWGLFADGGYSLFIGRELSHGLKTSVGFVFGGLPGNVEFGGAFSFLFFGKNNFMLFAGPHLAF